MRRVLLMAGALVVLGWFLAGPIFRSIVSYRIVGTRDLGGFTHAALEHPDLRWDVARSDEGSRVVIERTRELTADRLVFAASGTSNDPTELLTSNDRAHCVGYAALFAAMCNAGFQRSGSEQRCRQAVTRVHLFGMDMHPYFTTPFFRDHDICLVIDPLTQDTVAIDPVVFDLFGIEWVRIR